METPALEAISTSANNEGPAEATNPNAAGPPPTVPPEENRDRILSAAMARATVARQGADSPSPGDPLAPPAILPGNPAESEPRHDSPTAVSRLATRLPKLLEVLQEGLESARECAVSAL